LAIHFRSTHNPPYLPLFLDHCIDIKQNFEL
jgi:hypothetical protein